MSRGRQKLTLASSDHHDKRTNCLNDMTHPASLTQCKPQLPDLDQHRSKKQAARERCDLHAKSLSAGCHFTPLQIPRVLCVRAPRPHLYDTKTSGRLRFRWTSRDYVPRCNNFSSVVRHGGNSADSGLFAQGYISLALCLFSAFSVFQLYKETRGSPKKRTIY